MCESTKKKLKTVQRKNRQLRKKVESLTDIVENLKKNSMISETCAELLETTYSGVPLHLMKRLISGRSSNVTYHPALKAFALTLQFYSTKAYEYVRETFGLGLPHVATIRRWYSALDGSAGFCKEAFRSLERKVAATREGEQVMVALMLDEMAIKKHVQWDGKKMVGFVDIGNGVFDDSAPPATEALVLMAVALNSSWKVALGYFLIAGLTGTERANIVTTCILRLHDVGVRVVSLTCDGPSCHLSMLRQLGAHLEGNDPNEFDPSFPHPAGGDDRIYALLDVCHMLKLLRNAFAVCGLFRDKDKQIIRWAYLQELHRIQEREGLHLANKLRERHLCWQSQKMKVTLAAQTLSSSVADALEFCRDGLALAEFKNCEGTVKFLRLIDGLFDVLNSRNKFARGLKAAIKPGNGEKVMAFLDEAFQYIAAIKDVAGNLMFTTPKKTAFVGFLACIKSVKQIYKQHVGEDKPLKYLLTYKLSQDHLELFFGAIRAAGGFNNNPTTRQFVATYKRLLMRHDVEVVTGNTVPQDQTRLLTSAPVTSASRSAVEDSTNDILIDRRFDQLVEPTAEEIDAEIPSLPELSIYREVAVGYIAGFVARIVARRTNCPDCSCALSSKFFDNSNPSHGLILQKDRGGLCKPSDSVVRVCNATERLFQKLLFVTDQKLPQGPGVAEALGRAVLQEVGADNSVFRDLYPHMLDTEPDNNHVFSLIKAVSAAYTNVRMHHVAKQHNLKVTGKYVRKTMTKTILFKHQ